MEDISKIPLLFKWESQEKIKNKGVEYEIIEEHLLILKKDK